MDERDLKITELERENAFLKRELAYYKELLEKEKSKKIDLDDKLGQAKEVAKKGLDISKDVFSITKNVFGKAKDSFREEWEKHKTSNERIHLDKTTYGDISINKNAAEFTNDLLKGTLSDDLIKDLSSKLEEKSLDSTVNESPSLSSLIEKDSETIAKEVVQLSEEKRTEVFNLLSDDKKAEVLFALAILNKQKANEPDKNEGISLTDESKE